jgi:hypothetical protein
MPVFIAWEIAVYLRLSHLTTPLNAFTKKLKIKFFMVNMGD